MTYVEILSIMASMIAFAFLHIQFRTDFHTWENERPKPMKNGRRKSDV